MIPPRSQEAFAHISQTSAAAAVPLTWHVCARELRELVAKFGSHVLFRSSAGDHYGVSIQDALRHPLVDVMPVLDDNLAQMYPRHVELASAQQWQSLSPAPPLLPGVADRCVYGELVGAFARFWPDFAGVDDPIMQSRDAPAFHILDNMHVQKICNTLQGISPSLS